MLSRFVSSALDKLSIKESAPSKSIGTVYPTLSFPPPPPAGPGTRSLCARCLTLLSHVITQYGNGTRSESLALLHSSSISDLFELSQNKGQRNRISESEALAATLPCVLCTKTLILFNDARAHVSFESSLRNTACKEWSLSWQVNSSDSNAVGISLSIDHKGGYGWGIGKYSASCDLIQLSQMRCQFNV